MSMRVRSSLITKGEVGPVHRVPIASHTRKVSSGASKEVGTNAELRVRVDTVDRSHVELQLQRDVGPNCSGAEVTWELQQAGVSF